MSQHPRLHPRTVLRRISNPEKTFIVAKTPEQKIFELELWEKDFLDLLDGTRNEEEIAEAFQRIHPDMEFGIQEVMDYVEESRRDGLLELTDRERHLVMVDKLKTRRRRRFYDAESSNIFQIFIPAFDPDRMMSRVIPYIRWAWSPWFVLPWLLVGVLVFVFLGYHWDLYWRGFFGLWDPRGKTLWDWLGLYLLLNIVGVWHEFGHGFTLKWLGGEVHEIGWVIFYLEPTFYCRVDDAYLLPERSKRIWVSLGGPYWETMLASVAAAVWLTTPSEWWIHGLALTTVFITGLSTLLFNINPLIKLDGYYVLMDYLDIPDLREDSFQYIGNLIKRRLLRMEVPRTPISRRRRRAYLLYGICSVLYTLTLMTVLFTIVKRWMLGWFGATGYLVLAAVIVLVFRRKILSALRFFRTVWLDKREALRSSKRWGPTGFVLILLLFLALVPRWPTRVEGWFLVEPGRRAVVRAPADGKVRSVRVREGEEVARGDILAVMSSFELEPSGTIARADRDRALREMAEAQRKGDSTQAVVKAEQAEEASARLALLESRLSRLTLTAPFDGVVATPFPEDEQGRALREGDTVCEVDDLRTVKLGVAISEREIQEVHTGVAARILLVSEPERTLTAHVLSVAPVARPPAGAQEQALDVVRSMNRVRVLVGIENAEGRLRPGMSGRVQFLTRPRSLAGKIGRQIYRWASALVW